MSRPRTAFMRFPRRLAALGRGALLLWCAAAVCLVPVRVRLAEAGESACGCSAATRESGKCCCIEPEPAGPSCCAAKKSAARSPRSCCAVKFPESRIEVEVETNSEPSQLAAKPQADGASDRAELRSCPCGGGSSLPLGCEQPRFVSPAPRLELPRRGVVVVHPRPLGEPQWVESPGTPPPEVGRASNA